MIRYSPIGLVLALLLIVLGPHNVFSASNRPAAAPVQSSAVSWILPDASQESPRPLRGGTGDMVLTKQGWMIRKASKRQLISDGLIAAVIIAFAWPLRRRALARRDVFNEEDGDS